MAGTRGCSPRLETARGRDAAGLAASSGGEDGAELGEGALQGLLRASGLLESMRCVAADVYKGSAWPGDRQRRVIAAAHRTHRRGVPGKIPCAVLVDGSMQGSSGPLDSTGNFGIELRSRWRGQGGRRCARGDGGRRRSTGGMEEQWRIGRKKATGLYPWPKVPGQKFSRYLCRP